MLQAGADVYTHYSTLHSNNTCSVSLCSLLVTAALQTRSLGSQIIYQHDDE